MTKVFCDDCDELVFSSATEEPTWRKVTVWLLAPYIHPETGAPFRQKVDLCVPCANSLLEDYGGGYTGGDSPRHRFWRKMGERAYAHQNVAGCRYADVDGGGCLPTLNQWRDWGEKALVEVEAHRGLMGEGQ